MKNEKMINLMKRLEELAKNVAFSEKNGFDYDKEEVKEDLETITKKIYAAIEEAE